jgi:alkaline phosphatase D
MRIIHSVLALALLAVGSTQLHAQRDIFGGLRHRVGTYVDGTTVRLEPAVVDPALRPFYLGVASGDPLTDRVIIWTRVTPDQPDDVTVQWRVATDTGLQNIVASGSVSTNSNSDYTVKVDASGLQPASVYYYAFTYQGLSSLIGRTRTLSAGEQPQARFAVVSCSNYPTGYFNAYRKIAERNDLDAVLHLGDYIYEYSADSASYGGQIGIALGRQHDPAYEIISLADYRTRYAQYRLDPDLRAVHQQHAMIHVWDDHESANDSYVDGAENHDPATEGSWDERKAISKRVHAEWMPIREQQDKIYRRFAFGDLVDLWMLDTRLNGRDKQIQLVGSLSTPESRDSIESPTRKIMSEEQFNWLSTGLSSSTTSWRFLGNQVMFTPISISPIDTTFLYASVPPLFAAFLRQQMPALQGLVELAFYGDVWNNYPAQRQRLTDLVRSSNISNVVIGTGDFHTAFAFNTSTTYSPDTSSVAVEFMCPSISAPNFDETLNSNTSTRLITPQLIATLDTTLKQRNPHLAFENLVEHGYTLIDFTKERVQGDFFFIDTILARPSGEQFVAGYATPSGSSRLTRATAPAPGKAIQDIPAPERPPVVSRVHDDQGRSGIITVLNSYPQPAVTLQYLSMSINTTGSMQIDIVDQRGSVVAAVVRRSIEPGLLTIVADVSTLPAGTYSYRITVGDHMITYPLVCVR